MTTVLADVHLGVMVSDSCVTDGDRIWSGPKVYRIRGDLLGFAGDIAARSRFLEWWKKGGLEEDAPTFKGGDALVMKESGKLLYYHGDDLAEEILRGREAIGTGGQAAIAAYEALGWKNPRRAVAIACNHDARSRPPVRLYRLKGGR
jgi:ATP-dependent protease HslVU (ClpYQ) peptidase subunit